MNNNNETLKAKFGKHLIELRENRKFSQGDLAGKLDADISWLSKIETGKRDIQLTTIGRLAKALDVPLKELLDFDI